MFVWLVDSYRATVSIGALVGISMMADVQKVAVSGGGSFANALSSGLTGGLHG